jgi:hypothetical protein
VVTFDNVRELTRQVDEYLVALLDVPRLFGTAIDVALHGVIDLQAHAIDKTLGFEWQIG